MARRKVSNPLALAVLSLLLEKPMHPYEMSSTLRERSKETSIKLNYGSLYSVVDALRRHDLIDVHETLREGKRPERTVYAITDAGREEFVSWQSELLSVPVKEFTQFEAALSLLGTLPVDEVLRLLEVRRMRLSADIGGNEAAMATMLGQGLPYMFLIEFEYAICLSKAELGYLDNLIDKIRTGTLPGIDVWRRAYEGGDGLPDAAAWQRALGDASW